MTYLGDFALSSNIDLKFATTAAATGAPTTLSGTPVISAYPDNGTTQLTAGITLTADFDSVTGLNHVRVAATGANGYAAGSTYQLVITTGTVGGTSAVGYVVGQFSIEARSALRPTVAGRTVDVAATGEVGIDIANMNIPVGAIPLFGITDNGVAQSATGTAVSLRSAAAFSANQLIGATYYSAGESITISANDASDGVTLSQAFKTNPGAVQYYVYGTAAGSGGSGLDAAATRAALGLASANLDTQLADIPTVAEMNARTLVAAGYASPTNITAGTITTVTNLTNAPTAGDLTATMKASVNAEVLDVLNTDTFAEPGQGAPGATITLAAKIGYLFKAWRNRSTQTASEYALYADNATTKDQEAVVSSDGTTLDRGEVGTGA